MRILHHKMPPHSFSLLIFPSFWFILALFNNSFPPASMFILVEHKCLIALVPDTLSVVDTCWESKKILARAGLFTKLLSS